LRFGQAQNPTNAAPAAQYRIRARNGRADVGRQTSKIGRAVYLIIGSRSWPTRWQSGSVC
jgi:hypothetical protein